MRCFWWIKMINRLDYGEGTEHNKAKNSLLLWQKEWMFGGGQDMINISESLNIVNIEEMTSMLGTGLIHDRF